ncbi:MAG: nuclear transport factor 2 family protein [Luteimonas sp.]|nr:nuclear transport factor 2 family protein [Luteimonas sp.]
MTEPSTSKSTSPSAAHRLLDVFVGTWRVGGHSFGEGQQADNPRASAVPWKGEQTYDWLPGGFFLRNRGHAAVGSRTLISTEIVGYDKAKAGYLSNLFDNSGFHPDYQGSVDGDVWTFSAAGSRSRLAFSDENRKLEINWEWRNDGSDWLPLCDLVATRVDGAPTSGNESETAIRRIIDARGKAVDSGDVDAMVADTADDLVTFDVVEPLRSQGKSAARKRAETWVASFASPIQWESRDVVVTTDGDVGFSHALSHVMGTQKTGATVDMWFRTTLGFRRIGNRWLVVHEHSSSPFDPKSGEASLGLKP